MRRVGKVNDVGTSSESMQSVKRGDAPSMSARADQKLGASESGGERRFAISACDHPALALRMPVTDLVPGTRARRTTGPASAHRPRRAW
jgi:hypothetical protein